MRSGHWICFGLASAALCAGLALAGVASAEPDGKALYEKNCASCHGPDARGNTPVGKALKIMDLGTKHWASPDSIPEIVKVVRDGVPRMPAMSAKLKPEEIEAVARFTQQLSASGNPQE
jgi:mono/diheme cytochrome c family protein